MTGDLRQQANESAVRFGQAMVWARAHGMLSADTQFVSNEQARQQMDEIDKLIEEATREEADRAALPAVHEAVGGAAHHV